MSAEYNLMNSAYSGQIVILSDLILNYDVIVAAHIVQEHCMAYNNTIYPTKG